MISMVALAFYKAATMDKADLGRRIIEFLDSHGFRYCAIGGQAVNAYVEPLVSLDLDLVVLADDLPRLERELRTEFHVEDFPHSLNVSEPGSALRIQFQKDPRYGAFLDRAEPKDVLGLRLPVARIADVFQGKIWDAMNGGSTSEKQRHLTDIARMIGVESRLRQLVPSELRGRLRW